MGKYLSVDARLLRTAMRAGGLSSGRETVHEALREFVARRQQRRVLDFFGRVDWDSHYDYKSSRGRSFFQS